MTDREKFRKMADEWLSDQVGPPLAQLLVYVHNSAVAQCQQAVNDTGTFAPDRHLPSLVKATSRAATAARLARTSNSSYRP